MYGKPTLLGDTIKDMLEEEMNEHLGYEKYKHILC